MVNEEEKRGNRNDQLFFSSAASSLSPSLFLSFLLSLSLSLSHSLFHSFVSPFIVFLSNHLLAFLFPSNLNAHSFSSFLLRFFTHRRVKPILAHHTLRHRVRLGIVPPPAHAVQLLEICIRLIKRDAALILGLCEERGEREKNGGRR